MEESNGEKRKVEYDVVAVKEERERWGRRWLIYFGAAKIWIRVRAPCLKLPTYKLWRSLSIFLPDCTSLFSIFLSLPSLLLLCSRRFHSLRLFLFSYVMIISLAFTRVFSFSFSLSLQNPLYITPFIDQESRKVMRAFVALPMNWTRERESMPLSFRII